MQLRGGKTWEGKDFLTSAGAYEREVVVVDGLLHQARLRDRYPERETLLPEADAKQLLGPITHLLTSFRRNRARTNDTTHEQDKRMKVSGNWSNFHSKPILLLSFGGGRTPGVARAGTTNSPGHRGPDLAETPKCTTSETAVGQTLTYPMRRPDRLLGVFGEQFERCR